MKGLKGVPEYQQSWPMPKNPIPIVVFGAGSIVSDAHLPAYKMSNLPIKGIYDPDHEKAKKLMSSDLHEEKEEIKPHDIKKTITLEDLTNPNRK